MAQPNQRIEVLKPFYFNREVQGVGSVIDVPKPFALEMKSANKAKLVQSDVRKTHNTTVQNPNEKLAAQQAAFMASQAAASAAASKAAAGGK